MPVIFSTEHSANTHWCIWVKHPNACIDLIIWRELDLGFSLGYFWYISNNLDTVWCNCFVANPKNILCIHDFQSSVNPALWHEEMKPNDGQCEKVKRWKQPCKKQGDIWKILPLVADLDSVRNSNNNPQIATFDQTMKFYQKTDTLPVVNTKYLHEYTEMLPFNS